MAGPSRNGGHSTPAMGNIGRRQAARLQGIGIEIDFNLALLATVGERRLRAFDG